MNQKDIETLAIALPEDILKAKWCGDFDRAFHLIDLYLANEKVPAFMKTRLALEREVLKALPTGYTYSEEDALALVQKEIPDFTKAELDALRDRGAIDWIYINGKTTYSRTFYDTLLGVYPDIATRAGKPPKDKSDRVEFLRQNVRDMKKDGDALWSIQLRAQFRLHDDVFRPGEELTVHLPVPKNAMNMRDIEILATSHPIYKLADENAPARTVSFRGKFEKNETFWVEYKYLSYVKYNNLESAQVSAEQPTFDTEELYPHIRFTPLIRALCKELSGDEKNPLLLARRFYDYCTKVGTYSYVREYFALPGSIPDYYGAGLHGDCGVQALLFITLCRIAGIPAKWQSGIDAKPGDVGEHDWAMFYVPGSGWVYADLSYGGSSYIRGAYDRWNYFFGNADPYRIPINNAFQKDFEPPKWFWRNDPYDNQSGEAEYEDHGVRSDDLLYRYQEIDIHRIK